jgi:hypothetical protein
MELHRLAFAVMAVLVAVSMMVAVGRIAASYRDSSSVQAPTSTTRSGDAPVVRLGTPRSDGSKPPPLLEQPAPRPDVTPRARQARESSESKSPDSVSVGAG